MTFTAQPQPVSLAACSRLARAALQTGDRRLYEACHTHAVEMTEQSAAAVMARVNRDLRLAKLLEVDDRDSARETMRQIRI